MDADICNNGDEAAASSSQHRQPSSQFLREPLPVSTSTPPSPSSPLSSTVSPSSPATSASDGLPTSADAVEQVDSFLRDALNSRNRITVLRLEVEVEKFVRNSEKQRLLLDPMPSSYERLAAHRVAQHYHVQSMALDSGNPSAPWVLLVKTPDSKLPSIKLAQLPLEPCMEAKVASPPPGKLAIKQRARPGSIGDESTSTGGIAPVRSVEERMEEYNKARARIFSNGDSRIMSDEILALNATYSVGSERDAGDKDVLVKSANSVAIFRDREKDMRDPDYDRTRYSPSTRIASISPSTIQGLNSSVGLGSSSVAQCSYGQVQRQASCPSAHDIHGCIWFGADVSSIGYPHVLPNALGQTLHPRPSNVYLGHEEFLYQHQCPSKTNSCSMLSTHPTFWFQNY